MVVPGTNQCSLLQPISGHLTQKLPVDFGDLKDNENKAVKFIIHGPKQNLCPLSCVQFLDSLSLSEGDS